MSPGSWHGAAPDFNHQLHHTSTLPSLSPYLPSPSLPFPIPPSLFLHYVTNGYKNMHLLVVENFVSRTEKYLFVHIYLLMELVLLTLTLKKCFNMANMDGNGVYSLSHLVKNLKAYVHKGKQHTIILQAHLTAQSYTYKPSPGKAYTRLVLITIHNISYPPSQQ